MNKEDKANTTQDFWGYCNYCRGNVIVHTTKYDEDDFYTQECTKCYRKIKVKIGGASQGQIIE